MSGRYPKAEKDERGKDALSYDHIITVTCPLTPQCFMEIKKIMKDYGIPYNSGIPNSVASKLDIRKMALGVGHGYIGLDDDKKMDEITKKLDTIKEKYDWIDYKVAY